MNLGINEIQGCFNRLKENTFASHPKIVLAARSKQIPNGLWYLKTRKHSGWF